MPTSTSLIKLSTSLSEAGIDDLHLRVIARRSNVRKEFIRALDELIETAAELRVVQMIRQERLVEIAKPGPMRAERDKKRRMT